MAWRIEEDDLSSEATRELLALHLRGMHAGSPPGTVFALDLSGLKQPGITVWSLREDDDGVIGIGALRQLDARSGEIKSMRTRPDRLRRGVGAALLGHIVEEARRRGYARLSLETGSGEPFEPALAMYRRHGFADGEAFGGYTASAFNRFLHRTLTPPSTRGP